MAKKKESMATLNEVADILGLIKANSLGSLVNPGINVAGCDYDCSCNHSMCDCRGSIKHGSVLDSISYPEFVRVRQERLEELKKELENLAVPAAK